MAKSRSKRKKSRSSLDILSIGVACIMFYGFFSSFFQDHDTFKSIPEETSTETVEYVLVGDSLSRDTLITHYRYWKDYWSNSYRGTAKVLASEVRAAGKHRDQLPIFIRTEEDWGTMYKAVTHFEGSNLEQVISMLDSIRTEENLSMDDFADVIVCFVQDIPYTLILEPECTDLYQRDASIKKIIDNGTTCYGNIRYGVNTPAEFIGSMHGDCDTRTVLLFKIMSKLGFDVAILGSEFYRHSILGINMPGTGDYLRYRGKKYHVWETTNTGWERGVMPPDNSTLSYWEVNLASQMN